MKINKLYIDGYKNLTQCEITPSPLHAITGVNGSGKSNFLEIFQFIAALITRDDTFRDNLLINGHCPSGSQWFPMQDNYDKNKTNDPFKFNLECEITVNETVYLVNYLIEIAEALLGDKHIYDLKGQGLINCETVTMKQMGTPGPMKTILQRDKEGGVTVHTELNPRNSIKFKTKKNMSAIQALEVREADDFIEKHPVLNEFKVGLITSVVVKLNPDLINDISESGTNSNYKLRTRSPGSQLNSFSLFESVELIKNNEIDWKEYCYWLKKLCYIDTITPYKAPTKNDESIISEQKVLLLTREGRTLIPKELSTGNLILLSLVTALFSLLRTSGVVIFEEPETYIHPKALVDLIALLRNISEDKTVLFSTHSPVALNSMNSKEVSLMLSSEHGKYTTKIVSEIQEASDALTRGYLSFGDLLQSNFMTDSHG